MVGFGGVVQGAGRGIRSGRVNGRARGRGAAAARRVGVSGGGMGSSSSRRGRGRGSGGGVPTTPAATGAAVQGLPVLPWRRVGTVLLRARQRVAQCVQGRGGNVEVAQVLQGKREWG